MAPSIVADMIAVIHLGYVAFVVVGFILIICGAIFSWKWIRNRWFRLFHLAAIVGVALEALLGINCPLTVLEFSLRYGPTPADRRVSFVGELVDSILYYDAPAWLFTIIYVAFALLVAITFVMAPPSRRGH